LNASKKIIREEITREELNSLVDKAADLIRTAVDYKFILVLLFLKRLNDLWKNEKGQVKERLVKEAGLSEKEAENMQKKKLLVSTSNDDLPALAFYQSRGFQIYEVKPNVIAEKHGRILEGIGGLPARDELRLRKILY